jgi:membrane protein DedA with SNARE-associated domain
VDFVPSWASSHGWWAAFVFLFFVVFFRAQGTYWLGRGVASGALKTRLRAKFEGPTMTRAHAFLEKWGPVGVPVSFLTIGFQTAVQAAAGLGRMRAAVYTLAMIPGCIAWAAIYTALGATAVDLYRNLTWGFAAVLTVAVVGLVAFVVIRRRRNAGSAVRTPR